jgi:hypothetical protein
MYCKVDPKAKSRPVYLSIEVRKMVIMSTRSVTVIIVSVALVILVLKLGFMWSPAEGLGMKTDQK